MVKVLSVVGARPNYVKLAAVWEAFSMFEHVVVDTGQHYDYEMNRVFFEQLSVPEPHYFLGVGSGSHGYQVGEGIKRVEEVLLRERPDVVVVYGDTNSALAGALAAAKAGFKVAHVEAGLRVFDMTMPEELNRRVIDHVSTLLFAPTPSAVSNLEREGVLGEVYLTYDVHVDLFFKWRERIEERAPLALSRHGLRGDFIVVTVHRAENVDVEERLRRLAALINEVSNYVEVFFPVHPRTEKALQKFGLRLGDRVVVSKPLGYLDFLAVLSRAKGVLTDSGGVQREGYLLGKRVGVVRDRTEWVELREHGCVTLLFLDVDRAVNYVKSLDSAANCPVGLLGDGKAAQRIASIIYSRVK